MFRAQSVELEPSRAFFNKKLVKLLIQKSSVRLQSLTGREKKLEKSSENPAFWCQIVENGAKSQKMVPNRKSWAFVELF